MEDIGMTFYATLDDIFVSADILSVVQTPIDTVRIDAVIRKSGEHVWAEEDDLDLAASALDLQIERKLWLIDDILDEYNLDRDELRQLLGTDIEDYADGYDNGWEDAVRFEASSFEMGELAYELEEEAYDDGWYDGWAARADYDEVRLIPTGYDYAADDPPQWLLDEMNEDLDYLTSPATEMDPALVAAAQPFLAEGCDCES